MVELLRVKKEVAKYLENNKKRAIRDIITLLYLKWNAHMCRDENVRLTKKVYKTALPTGRFYIGPWLEIGHMLGIATEQSKRAT